VARLQVDAGIAALKAIATKDLGKLLGEVGDKILNSCQSCHERYLKPSSLRPGAK
jgi:hypothetical protein